MSYKLDTTAARQADRKQGRIEDIGAYVGHFVRAEDITAKTGTKGIEFEFESDDGGTLVASIWTINAKGDQIFGFRQLQALMTCLGLREINEKTMKVEKYDRDARARIEVEAVCFPELMDKPIGIFVETEGYMKNDGSVGSSAKIAAFFRTDKFMASEILDRAKEAMQYEKTLSSLRHRPLKGTRPAPVTTADIEDDDIPF